MKQSRNLVALLALAAAFAAPAAALAKAPPDDPATRAAKIRGDALNRIYHLGKYRVHARRYATNLGRGL